MSNAVIKLTPIAAALKTARAELAGKKSLSLSDIGGYITEAASVLSAALTLGKYAQEIYNYVVAAYTAAVAEYADERDADETVMTSVLAAAKAFVDEIGVDWDSISTWVQDIVDGIKSLISELTGDSTDSSDSTDSAAD